LLLSIVAGATETATSAALGVLAAAAAAAAAAVALTLNQKWLRRRSVHGGARGLPAPRLPSARDPGTDISLVWNTVAAGALRGNGYGMGLCPGWPPWLADAPKVCTPSFRVRKPYAHKSRPSVSVSKPRHRRHRERYMRPRVSIKESRQPAVSGRGERVKVQVTSRRPGYRVRVTTSYIVRHSPDPLIRPHPRCPQRN
jgi:hypothetical protein